MAVEEIKKVDEMITGYKRSIRELDNQLGSTVDQEIKDPERLKNRLVAKLLEE